MNDFPELLIDDYESLVAALRAVQRHLQISNSTFEQIAGLAAGAVDKYIGPSTSKRIGPVALGLLLGALGVRLRVEVDLEASQKMAGRWERKHVEQVRQHTRLSQAIIERARPIVLAELARMGAQATNKLKRERQARRQNGHANGHAR